MTVYIRSEVLLTLYTDNFLPQYIGTKDFPFDLDYKVNGFQFVSYLKTNFTNSDFRKGIYECKSGVWTRVGRVFAKKGENFFKICGDEYEKNMIGNKIIYFSGEHIYNLEYLRNNNNNFNINTHKLPDFPPHGQYNFIFNLYFVSEDISKIIKNDKKFDNFLNQQYRSGNVLNIFEAIFIDRGRYFLNRFASFETCEVVQILLHKTCDVRTVMSYKGMAHYVFDKVSCEEKIIQSNCIDLNSLSKMSSVPVIRHNRKLFFNNSQINNNNLQEIQLSNWDAVALLVFIFATIVATIVFVCAYIYRKCNLYSKDTSNTKQQESDGTNLSKDEGDIEGKNLLLEKIEEVVDKNSSISHSVC